MQTILGANGTVGIELAKSLTEFTKDIRLVSRNPRPVNTTDQLFKADLSNTNEVDKAVEGSEIVYLTVGLEYNIKVWQTLWPLIMKNVIDTCKKHKAKLVFFDNNYLYDKDFLRDSNEETPINPSSKKGIVRAQIAKMMMDEVKSGNLTGLIARSADFISDKNSVLIELVYKNLQKGKKANWLIDANKLHTFTFVPDAAKATALLGNTPEAYNQVWHLPTDNTPLTGKQWIEIIAKELMVEPRYSVLTSTAITLLGIFVPVLREFKEMAYQYKSHYVFNSQKFEKKFGIKPTPPAEAIRQVHQKLK